ncbi:hypothetical protein E8E14_012878 [Neopestalotiopsis sp. 37M]|nr:hypothetical protein E8E14_012878 [Neopestalotiopsis sp. 37M]
MKLLKLIFLLGAQSPVGNAAVATQRSNSSCQDACSKLAQIFPTALHYPNTDNFTIWDAKQQETTSACRLQPANASEVSQALTILISTGCEFAVKGGGHSRTPNDSKSVGGVTVDLGRIVDVTVAADRNSARLGGGMNLGQAFEALEAYNISFVGGRVASVGLGGFTLGGGTSPFSPRHGWAVDNVLEYEIVLANGTISVASENENPDLYWALRGGGNNFGIVTAFTYKTFPQDQVYNGRSSYGQIQTEQVLDKVYDLFTSPAALSDLSMGYDLYYSYSGSADSFTMLGVQRYSEPVANASVFADINTIPTLTRSEVTGYMSDLVSNPPLGTIRHWFGTVSIRPSRELMSQAISIFEEEVQKIQTVAGLSANFVCYTLHPNAINTMKVRGGNALGIDQGQPLILILISTDWTTSDGDAPVEMMTTSVVDRIAVAAQELQVYDPYMYINYAYAGQADKVFSGYGEENRQRLKAIQASVDPDGVFTSQGLWRGFMKLA